MVISALTRMLMESASLCADVKCGFVLLLLDLIHVSKALRLPHPKVQILAPTSPTLGAPSAHLQVPLGGHSMPR